MLAFWFSLVYSFIVHILYFFFGFVQESFTLFLLYSGHVSISLFIKVVPSLFWLYRVFSSLFKISVLYFFSVARTFSHFLSFFFFFN